MIKEFFVAAFLAVSAVSMLVPSHGAASGDVQWYTKDGKAISLDEAVQSLAAYDVALFGEYHDKAAVHQEELAFLEKMYAKNPELTLSLEMIERDVQPLLDRYLQGKATETEFVAASRPWKNYLEDYRPLVNFAKARRMDVIASNIPRYMAAAYAKSGTLDGIEDEQKQYLPRVHRVEHAAYYAQFAAYMNAGHSGMPMPPERIERFYQAQCLKDDTMAESIADAFAKDPKRRILHVQGEFHGRNGLGVAEKLKKLRPEIKVAVITSILTDGSRVEAQIIRQRSAAGDLLLLVRTEAAGESK